MRKASEFRRYDKLDILCCAAAMLLTLWIGLCSLDSGISWGDDWAGYLGEGIAIARGELDEYAVRLITLHPTELTSSMTDRIVYVWGKPLVNALVYRLAGFDEGKLLCYKIPDLVFFVLLSAALYLFFRRRTGRTPSLAMTMMFIGMSSLRGSLNRIMSDVQFLFFSILAIWLMDLFLAAKTRRKKLVSGAALGIALFASYVTRLNGFTLLIILAIGQAARLYLESNRRAYLSAAWIPYGVFALLLGVSCLFLPMATSNHSDFAQSTLEVIAENYRLFDERIGEWLAAMTFVSLEKVWLVRLMIYLIMLVGMWKRGGLEELHLSVLCFGTLAVTNMLPYAAGQGMRYYYTMLPLMLLFFAEGVSWIVERLLDIVGKNKEMWRRAAYILLACAACYCAVKQVSRESNSVNLSYKEYQTLREGMPELYACIRDELPDDVMIAYRKPRALNLLTGKMAFSPAVNGHSLSDADYYVDTYMFNTPREPSHTEVRDGCMLEPVRITGTWTMYSVRKIEN